MIITANLYRRREAEWSNFHQFHSSSHHFQAILGLQNSQDQLRKVLSSRINKLHEEANINLEDIRGILRLHPNRNSYSGASNHQAIDKQLPSTVLQFVTEQLPAGWWTNLKHSINTTIARKKTLLLAKFMRLSNSLSIEDHSGHCEKWTM